MYRSLTSILIIVCGLCGGGLAFGAAPDASSQPAYVDSDSDGLEDSLEAKLGTDPARADTDGDGLSDYDEYCKYRTDPTKKDSDGDGVPDGDWQERREYAYTVRAICEMRPPNDAALMNDLYQDVRPTGRKARLADGTVVEIVLFPFSTPHVFAQPYPRTELPEALRKYVARDLSMNFSDEMQKEIKERIVSGATTDVEAIEKILAWIASETHLANDLPELAFFNVVDNRIVWRQSLGSPEKDQEFLRTNFFGDAMFKSRRHGTCTSTATLRATMLRAAGIPTRLIQNLPLINRYEGDPEPLVEALRMRPLAKGYDWGQGGGGANHCYNEVFLNNHWIRVDHVINPGPFVGDKLFVKVYSLASWNERTDWRTPRPPEEGWNENRDFRTLEVSDAYPKYPSAAAMAIDMVVGNESLAVVANDDGSFKATISIRNKGTAPTPEFGVYFYAGDPQQNGRLLARHAAGPIMPGGTWNEYNPQLRLAPDEDTIVVLIDPEDRVKELDEMNNKATRAIPGRKAAQSSTSPKDSSAAAAAIDMAVGNEGLAVVANDDGSFKATISIRNQGAVPTPEFGVYFYAGDPQQKGRLLARHAAGPILPGDTWNELNPQLRLTTDEDTIVVLIDPDDKVQESDEANNKATWIIPGRKPVQSSESASGRQRYFVTTVVGPDQMTFEGQQVSWEQLAAALEQVPNRPQTVFQIAATSEDIRQRSDWGDARGRLVSLSHRYRFEYPSLIGVHPLGTKGGPPQTLPASDSTAQ
jgi:hypothetical protein